MPSIITCPACAGQMRLPDEAIGQQVCCPECSKVFTAAATPAAVPSAPRYESSSPVPASLDDGNGHAPAAVARSRGLVGAVELPPSSNDDNGGGRVPPRAAEPEKDTRPCPVCGKPVARSSRRCYECDTPLFPTDGPGRSWERDDRELERGPVRPPERRDRVPSRGVLVLVLGIISLLCVTVFVSPLGIILGVVAWVMGHGDLNRMAANEMDPDGGLTKGGWVCGMIGTILNTLITLACLSGMSMVLLQNNNHGATDYDKPVLYRDDAKDDGAGKNKGVQKQLPPVPAPLPPPPKKQECFFGTNGTDRTDGINNPIRPIGPISHMRRIKTGPACPACGARP
jgi:hypothetical protein